MRKQYGSYQLKNCVFCGRVATQLNKEGVYVCYRHLKDKIVEQKCVCGNVLELRKGKYGTYFNCVSCGNLSFDKGLTVKDKEKKREPIEITISSRDL